MCRGCGPAEVAGFPAVQLHVGLAVDALTNWLPLGPAFAALVLVHAGYDRLPDTQFVLLSLSILAGGSTLGLVGLPAHPVTHGSVEAVEVPGVVGIGSS